MKLFANLKTIAPNNDPEAQKIVKRNLKLLAALGFSEGPKIKRRRIEVMKMPIDGPKPRYMIVSDPRVASIGEEQVEYFEEEI